jgi:hypothetical protein
MSQGGYRDDRGEWPDDRRPQPPNSLRRPRPATGDEQYDPDESETGYQSRPTDFFGPARGPAQPDGSYAGPWYERRSDAGPYNGGAEPPQQRYPDAYVNEPGGYVPQRYEPNGPYGPGTPVSPGRMPPRGRPSDLRGAMPPDGRARRGAPDAGPAAFAGPDVRSTGQQPIYGPDVRTTGQQPYYGADPYHAQPTYDSDPRYAPYGGGPNAGQQTTTYPAEYPADGWTTGQQVRGPVGSDYSSYPGMPDESPPEPPRRVGRIVALLVVLVILAAAGTVGWIYFRNRNSADSTATNTARTQTFNTAPIASQKVDPKPLTTAEAFGAASIPSTAAGGSYRVVKADSATSCANAVTGQITTLVTSLGCTQAVRATMLSPDQAYVITAGILNMPDSAAATRLAGSVMNDIKTGSGRFNGFAAGGNTNVVTVAQARVAWDTRGHYVVYCVIALADGKAIATNDSHVPVIVDDVVEKYLANKVLAARAKASTSASSASPTPSHS